MVRKSLKERHLSTCIQLLITKHPSRNVLYFRHLLSCDIIEGLSNKVMGLKRQVKKEKYRKGEFS